MEDIKKVELHIHLDGSLRLETIIELALKEKLISSKMSTLDIYNKVSISENDKTLVDYLKKFDLPIAILQTEESLERVTFELIEDLARENTIYAEIRVAPIQHTKKGLKPTQIVESILKGITRAQSRYNIQTNLLLCAMRHLPETENMFLVDLAKMYKNRGVVGLDLAGDEAGYAVTLFRNFFKKAKKNNIPFTIHAGEARGSQSIIDSINLGASRLGHGIRAFENSEVLKLIKENNICLECCPKSNMDTNVIPVFTNYPLLNYLNSGINVTLNTDNRTVSNTNYNKEIILIKKYFEITETNILQFNINAINHAFISQNKKDKLLEKLTGDKKWN